MNHFLITRFNLKNLYSHDKNHQSVQTDDWTQRRFELFEKYCLPSVSAQTNKDFKWICLFSSDTKKQYRDKIASYQQAIPQFVPKFFDDAEMINFKAGLLEFITSLAEEKGSIVTTRLDNDDTIHKDFIKTIQQEAAAEKSKDVFYTCQFGYQFFEELNVAIKIPYFNNHFLTRVESDVENLKTVMDVDHFHVEESGITIKNISDKPMWIEVIHQSNVDNDIKMTFKISPVLRSLHLANFGLNIKTQPLLSAVSIFSTVFSVRILKQMERRLAQKFRRKKLVAR